MRIAISGAQCTGKTTFINDFLQEWPMYEKLKYTYRDVIKEKNLKLNEMGNEESQDIILNALCDDIINNQDKKNLILDRCLLDQLVYTTWLNANNKVSDKFLKKVISVVRESLVFYDLIFYTPITPLSPVVIEEKEQRSTNLEYRQEIDNIFKALMYQYIKHSKIFFPFDNKLGCPAIIELYGNRQERTYMAGLYIDKSGNPITESNIVDTEKSS